MWTAFEQYAIHTLKMWKTYFQTQLISVDLFLLLFDIWEPTYGKNLLSLAMGLVYYASNDSFLLRTGVDCDVSIQILCHALAYKYCGTLYKRHPKKSVAALQKKPIVE